MMSRTLMCAPEAAESIPEEGAKAEGERCGAGGGKRVGNDKKIRTIGPLTPWGYLR